MPTPQLTLTAPRTEEDLRIGRRVHGWLRRNGLREADLMYDGNTVQIKYPFATREDIQKGLDCMTAWNIARMRKDPLPPLYAQGVVYRREPMCRIDGRNHFCEEFLSAHEIYRRGFADCEDLSCALSAQYRLRGEPARAVAKPSAVGWHIVVQRADGTFEDPSAKLGMPVP